MVDLIGKDAVLTEYADKLQGEVKGRSLTQDALRRLFANKAALVSIFLLVASILGYFAYRQIWYEAKRAVRVTGPLEVENQAKSKRAKTKQGIAG